MRCIGVIDDNNVTQLFFSDLFAERGWDVVSWHSVQEVHEALQSPRTRQPDVIILDLHLRERNAGLDVLRELKAHPGTRDIPVIMSSGDVWALQSIPEASRDDVAAVLVKPFELDEAFGAIEYVLGQAEAPQSNASRGGGRSSTNT